MKALQTSRRSSEDSLASSEGTPTVRIHLEHLLGGEAASDREPQAAAPRASSPIAASSNANFSIVSRTFTACWPTPALH